MTVNGINYLEFKIRMVQKMGSFADYQGNNNIPEEKRFLFASQMCRILSLGGMMRTGEVKMFGHTITLLQPHTSNNRMKVSFLL